MQDRPNFVEMLDAVHHFLETEVAPRQTDHRDRFRTLIAMNALRILGREAEQEAELVRAEAEGLLRLLARDTAAPADGEQVSRLVLELNAELAARIRGGEVPPGTREHLLTVGQAKLRVASPKYLERYEQA